HIAQNAAITYLRFGLRCTVYDPLLHAGAIEQTTPRDVVIGVSHTGVTEGVIRAVARARARGIRTVCLTNTPGSPLAGAAEITLLTSVSSPRLISDVGVSRVAQAAMLDALGVAVVQFLKKRKEKR
ncbi:MAG: MurR/RpiR family transcriptional regulator, partial [Bacteroidota bacterium]